MFTFSRSKPAPAAAPVALSGAHAPTADDLQAAAHAFVGRYIETAPVAEARALELSARNGSLSITVTVSPTPGITITVDPGPIARIEIPTTPTN